MRSFFIRLNKFATSRRLAVWLIVALLAIVLIGNLIPQVPLPSPGAPHMGGFSPVFIKVISIFKLNNIYFSPLFFIIILLLLINLLFCMGRRVKLIFEDSAAAGRFFSIAGLPLIGSLIFHLSMIVIMTGAAYDISTKMRGAMVITQGQEVEESHENYVSVDEAPFFLENHSFFKIKLKEVIMKIDRGYILDTVAVLGITDGDFSRDYNVRVNQPAQYRDTMFVMQLYGFSPLVKLTDPDGNIVVNVYLNLAPPDEGEMVEDSFKLPGTDMELNIKLFPDAEMKDGKIWSHSAELRNPSLVIQLDKEVEDGKIKQRLYKGVMNPGEVVEFEGYKLNIGDIRYWFQFDVTKEPGKKIVYAGFWIGLVGLVLRLFLIFLKPIEDDELKNEYIDKGKIEEEKEV